MRYCTHVFASGHIGVGEIVAEAECAGSRGLTVIEYVDLEGFIVGVVNADALGDRNDMVVAAKGDGHAITRIIARKRSTTIAGIACAEAGRRFRLGMCVQKGILLGGAQPNYIPARQVE